MPPSWYIVDQFLRVAIALIVEVAVIAAGWKIMWMFALHKYNFFRQLFGLPKIPKAKLHVRIKEQRKKDLAKK
eukprot:1020803-Amorphochlora_amoeboformis.AAC.1